MCGISALVAPRPAPLRDAITAMTGAIRHRGPDDEGYALFDADLAPRLFGGPDTPDAVLGADLPHAPAARLPPPGSGGAARAALGHRRLSILDLSPAGHQPMGYADGRYWLTYNGEIYNYRELRAELEADGAAFLSGSDTEVLLAAYARWGPECLERFNGMWAFALLDRRERTLFAARDRFGIKPLYVWRAPDGTLALASEIKQLAALPGWEPRANRRRLHDFLAWSVFDHTDETLFDGVGQVPGGCSLTVDLDAPATEPEVRRWYALRAETSPADMETAAARVGELLLDSVRLRLRADVKVGSCLSGGIDSSSIVCLVNRELAAQGRGELQETVSSCSEDPRFDERRFIEIVRERTETLAHYVFPDGARLFDDLDRLVWHQDEPFASTSIFAQWCVFGAAREHGLSVMLDGQGADELFAGYRSAYASWIAELAAGGRLGALVRNVRGARALHGYKLRRLAAAPLRQLLPEALRTASAASTARLRRPWLRAELLVPEGLGRERHGKHAPGRSLSAWSLDQVLVSNLPMLLHYEDRNSMAHSVESRVPFLDYRLVEYVVSLPGELKIRDATTKAVLREAMRGTLPDAVRERVDKMAFVTPERAWFAEQAGRFRARLERACDVAPGLFDHERVSAMLERTAAGRRRNNSVLWRILCVGAWMERFEVAL